VKGTDARRVGNGLTEQSLFSAMKTLGACIVDGLALVAPNGGLVMANSAALELFKADGLDDIHTFEQRSARFIMLHADRRPVTAQDSVAARVSSGERIRDVEQIFIERGTGREYTLLFSGAPVYRCDGRVAFALLLFTDATERVRHRRTLERELGAAEERFRVLLDQLSELVLTRRRDGRITHVNRAVAEFVGKRPEELIGCHVDEVFTEAGDAPRVSTEVSCALRNGSTMEKRLLLIDAVGKSHDLDFRWRRIVHADDDAEVLAVGRDVTAFIDRERMLSAENEMMMALVDASRRIFMGLDPRALVESMIRGLRDVLGGTAVFYAVLREGAFAVTHDVEWPPHPGHAVHDDSLAQAVARREAWYDETERRIVLPIVEADGCVRWVVDVRLCERERLLPEASRFAAELLAHNFAVAVRNVTLYRELDRQRAEVIELNQMKSDLIAMLAHDFKGPLTTIAGFGQLLMDDEIDDPEERRHALKTMVDASMRLANLAADTLALSRLEENEPAFQTVDFDVTAIVGDVVHAYSPQRTIRFVCEYAPAIVNGDPQRLTQVFDNLVSNAIKYSPNGQPVDILVRREDGDVVIDVRDRGIGIPNDEIGTLFGRFARASNARKLGITGSGFGLYLAKQFVEKSGGRLTVFSIEGRGSTFSVHLPLADRPETAPAAAPKRVLVADDDDDARAFIAHALRRAGYAVRAVNDGAQALERLRVERFDAAVLDLEMPGLSGEDVRAHLDANGPRTTGLVLLSGLSRTPPPGWDAFVSKPFLLKDFMAAVERALRARQAV